MLAENAISLLNKLPFPEDFYTSPFKIPDFSALEIVNFTSNECPLFVNLPSYEKIRETCGTKNFFFSNAYEDIYEDNLNFCGKVFSYTYEDYHEDNLNFCCKEDIEILKKLGSKAFIVHSALHELLGHSPVKFFKKDENGEYNFNINNLLNPLTNCPFDKL